MHIQLGTTLVVVAMISAVLLFVKRDDKLFPVVALVAAGLATLIAFQLLSLSVAKYRIDVILPALMLASAGACWMRTRDKTMVTAATALGFSSAVLLLSAMSILR